MDQIKFGFHFLTYFKSTLTATFVIAISPILIHNRDSKGHCYFLWEYLLTVMLLDTVCEFSKLIYKICTNYSLEVTNSYLESCDVETHHDTMMMLELPISGITGMIWASGVFAVYNDVCMNYYKDESKAIIIMFWITFGYSVFQVIRWVIVFHLLTKVKELWRKQRLSTTLSSLLRAR